MFAALNGHVSLVRLLLKHGADKEMVSAMGQKAVNIAWTVGREDIVKVREAALSLLDAVFVICCLMWFVVSACAGVGLRFGRPHGKTELQWFWTGTHECY